MTVVSRAKKGRMKYDVLREPTDAIGFLRTTSVDKVLENTKDIVAILGHTRAATVGSISKENTHPFTCNHVIGMHNGTIRALGDKDRTDSEELYERISKQGLKAALDSFEGPAAYALVWVDTVRDTLHMIRNKERPLWVMTTKSGCTMYYASERAFLELMNARSATLFDKPELLPEDKLVTFHMPNMKPTIREVKREVKPFFPITPEKVVKPSGQVPFIPSTRPPMNPPPITVIGPAHSPLPSNDTDPSLAAAMRGPVFNLNNEQSEPNKFDIAMDLFHNQVPHSGFPHKISLPCVIKEKDGSRQLKHVNKQLWFSDFQGLPQMPAIIWGRLRKGCLISGTKCTLDDVVYWIDKDTFVMPWHKNDDFVLEYTNGVKPRRGHALYASIASVANLRKTRAATEASRQATAAMKQAENTVGVICN